MSHARPTLALLIATACGPSAVEDAELREICGEVGPVRVLEFPEDARPYADAWVSRLGDDRLLWTIASAAPDYESYPWPHRAWGTWITGICGESPTQVPDILSADVNPRLPGVLVTIAGIWPYDFAVIDPESLGPQSSLFTGVGAWHDWSKHGLVSVDERDVAVGSVSFRAYPANLFSGAVAPTTLASIDLPSERFAELSDANLRITVHDDSIWVLTSDDEVVRIAMPSGETSVEQVGVRTFAISDDERWLVWEDLSILDYGSIAGEPIGRSRLRDRDDGTERSLWIGHAVTWRAESVEEGVIRSPLGWLQVDDLSPVELPEGRELDGPFGDHRYWVTTRHAAPLTEGDAEPDGYGQFDVATNTEAPLFEAPAWVTAWRDDGLELMHAIEHGTPPHAREVPLWFAPFDGSAPRKLAERATNGYARMPDDSIVTPLHFAPDYRSVSLMLVDPDTLETSRVDDHVFLIDRLRPPDPEIWGDDVVLYSVADGDRSGMWIARLP